MNGADYLMRVYSRHRIRRRDLDANFDQRHLDRFVRTMWTWTGIAVGIIVVGGFADLVGLLP